MIAALEKMAGGFNTLLILPGVCARNSQNDLAEGCIRNLHEGVNVIGHPAISMNARPKLANRVGYDRVQHLPVCGRAEDGLPVITPEGHVIEASWNMQA